MLIFYFEFSLCGLFESVLIPLNIVVFGCSSSFLISCACEQYLHFRGCYFVIAMCDKNVPSKDVVLHKEMAITQSKEKFSADKTVSFKFQTSAINPH